MGFCVCGDDDFAEDWQRWDDHPARKQWEVIKDLGAGALSQVVLARNKQTGEHAALKVVFLESPAVIDDPEHLAILQRESDLLSMLDHPHLVELKDVVRSPKHLVLVLEWLRGGQVIDRLHELGLQYSEQQAAAIFVQAAEAVAHLHEYHVLHRDIKPENLMFATPPAESKQAPLTAAQLQSGRPLLEKSSMPVVKLIDLGMACLYDPNNPITGPLGSPGFVAPEIIHGGVHAPPMDVFSLGVLLFIMLVGRKPFNIKESESLRYATMHLTEAPGLKDPRWLDLSPDAKHLVMGMLSYDPARRLTMQQVLNHEWVLSRGGVLPRPLGQDVVFGAATVASIRRLRNLCGGVVAFNRAAAATNGAAAGKSSASGGGGGRGKSGGGGGAKAGGSWRGGRGGGSVRGGNVQADSAMDVYLKRLKLSQRLDPSYRRGTAMNRLAASLASSAYAKAHDAGGSIHPKDDVSVRRGVRSGSSAATSQDGSSRLRRTSWRRNNSSFLGGGSMHGPASADPSTSRRNRFTSLLPGGMVKSPTTVMLSEMERGSSRDLSRKAGKFSGSAPLPPLLPQQQPSQQQQQGGLLAGAPDEVAGNGMQRRPSTLQLLSAAARVYMEGSHHGSRRGGSAGLAAAAGGSGAISPGAAATAVTAAAGHAVVGGVGGSSGTLRQQSGDLSVRSVAKRRQQVLPGVADASTSSSASSNLGQVQPQPPLTAAGIAIAPAGAVTAATAAPAADAPEGQQRSHGSGASEGGSQAASPPAPPPSAPGDAEGSRGGSTNGTAGVDSTRNSLSLDGLRPHRVVQRRSLDNPLGPVPPPAGGSAGRTWVEMQAQLRQQAQVQTPRSSQGRNSTDGSARGGTPSTRVLRIKPLE